MLLAGCSCDAPPPTTTSTPEIVEVEPPRASLPSASRSDLPAVTPMVTVEITNDEFHVSNTALLATWPARDRDALTRTQPTGDARWPEVDEQVHAHGDDIAIPTLREAFAHAANVDRARASLSGSTATPIAFAVRAAPDVRFVRVLQAIYAAGLVGYAEPRLVLSGTASEVVLPLPLPRIGPPADGDRARDLGLALAAAGLGGPRAPDTEPTAEPTPPAEPTPVMIATMLAADGLHISRGAEALAPGCGETSTTDVVTITTADLTPSRLTACLDAAVGSDAATSLTFRTSPDTEYASAIAILETLASRGPVGLAVAR